MNQLYKSPAHLWQAGASLLVFVVLLFVGQGKALGAETRAAVAANFTAAAKELGDSFTRETGHRVRFSFGSTGQLYTQMVHGAPYDLFLAADQARPKLAVDTGLAVPDSRFTYALGRIALYTSQSGSSTNESTLHNTGFQKLAIANPATAPYGAAAIEALRALSLYDQLVDKLVYGTNIAQTFQFIHSGSADYGIVALAQAKTYSSGSHWIIPANLHAPIAQDAVLLKSGSKNTAALTFLDFLQGPTALALLEKYGYGAAKK